MELRSNGQIVKVEVAARGLPLVLHVAARVLDAGTLGVLTIMTAHQDEAVITLPWVIERTRMGRDAARRHVAVLVHLGLIKRIQHRSKGRMSGAHYECATEVPEFLASLYGVAS